MREVLEKYDRSLVACSWKGNFCLSRRQLERLGSEEIEIRVSYQKWKADNKACDRIRSTVLWENSIPVNPRIVKVSINISRAQLHATGRDDGCKAKQGLLVRSDTSWRVATGREFFFYYAVIFYWRSGHCGSGDIYYFVTVPGFPRCGWRAAMYPLLIPTRVGKLEGRPSTGVVRGSFVPGVQCSGP